MPLSETLRARNIVNVITTGNSIGQNQTGNVQTSYIALSSTPVNADGTGVTEPSGNGYRRVMTRFNEFAGAGSGLSPNFPTNPTLDPQTGKYSIANSRDIYFFEATGSWGTLGYFAIFSAPNSERSDNYLVAYGQLANAISPTAGTIPVIRAGDLIITEQ